MSKLSFSSAGSFSVFAILFACSTTSLFAQQTISDSQSSAVTLVHDCPTTISTVAPSRTVVQFINNVYHEWEEYDLDTTSVGTPFCIKQTKPIRKKLNSAESKALLAESAKWKSNPAIAAGSQVSSQPARALKTRDIKIDKKNMSFNFDEPQANTEDKAALPFYPTGEAIRTIDDYNHLLTKPQSAVGTDDRLQIFDASIYPYNTISYVEMNFSDGTYRGSGWLVGPNSLLTCAHNVYDKDTNTYVSSFTLTPAMKPQSNQLIGPYGTRSASRIMISDNYKKVNPDFSFDYDYAIVNFNEPFQGNGTYMPLVFGAIPDLGTKLNVTGYPAVVNNWAVFDMFTAKDSVTKVFERRLEFLTDASPGNSGGPVYTGKNDLTNIKVNSILTYGYSDNSANGSTRLTNSNKNSITQWMTYDADSFTSVNLALSAVKINYNRPKRILNGNFSVTNPLNQEITVFYKYYLSSDPVLGGGDFLLHQAAVNVPSSVVNKKGKPLKKVKPFKIKTVSTNDMTVKGKYIIVVLDSTNDPDASNNQLSFGPFK